MGQRSRTCRHVSYHPATSTSLPPVAVAELLNDFISILSDIQRARFSNHGGRSAAFMQISMNPAGPPIQFITPAIFLTTL
ncbi:hypothetical protein J6590_027757 [Homalodisca vitripennis]|nr:hypothetical protein J6590_027757 [Homalodisca vitripennis]